MSKPNTLDTLISMCRPESDVHDVLTNIRDTLQDWSFADQDEDGYVHVHVNAIRKLLEG